MINFFLLNLVLILFIRCLLFQVSLLNEIEFLKLFLPLMASLFPPPGHSTSPASSTNNSGFLNGWPLARHLPPTSAATAHSPSPGGASPQSSSASSSVFPHFYGNLLQQFVQSQTPQSFFQPQMLLQQFLQQAAAAATKQNNNSFLAEGTTNGDF